MIDDAVVGCVREWHRVMCIKHKATWCPAKTCVLRIRRLGGPHSFTLS